MSDFNFITTAGRAWVSAATALQDVQTLQTAQTIAQAHPNLKDLAAAVKQVPLGMKR